MTGPAQMAAVDISPAASLFGYLPTALRTPGLTIDERAKAAGTQTTFIREAGPKDLLRITFVKDQSRDETVIRFKEGSTPKFDGSSDAYKMSNAGIQSLLHY